jgi:hypothetical protein
MRASAAFDRASITHSKGSGWLQQNKIKKKQISDPVKIRKIIG